MNPALSLPRVLRFDALTCLAMAALLAAAGGPLAGWLGLPVGLLHGAAALLLPCAALMLLAARQAPGRTALARWVIAGNAGWVLASLAVAFVLFTPPPLGLAAVLGQAAAVALLAVVEARALGGANRLRAA